MKRKSAKSNEIEACKRQFWEESSMFVLRRSARLIRNGETIEKRDRDFVAWRLENLADREWQKVKSMNATAIMAQMADYLALRLRIPLDQAAAAVSGDKKSDTIRKAVDRLRRTRRMRR